MTLTQAIVHLYDDSSHDDIARAYGWSDLEQMRYYENMEGEAPPMTDREVEQMVEREENIAEGTVEYLAPPPSEILVLSRQDSREIYTDSEDCPPDGFRDWTGVY